MADPLVAWRLCMYSFDACNMQLGMRLFICGGGGIDFSPLLLHDASLGRMVVDEQGRVAPGIILSNVCTSGCSSILRSTRGWMSDFRGDGN